MTEKEKALIAGCLRNDKAAWDAFVQQYSSLVYHTIKKTFSFYHSEPHTEQIEDLYQDFFVSVFRDDFKKLREFRGNRGCSLASWLRLVAARLTIDFLRKGEPTYGKVTENIPSSQPNPPGGLVEPQTEDLLLQAVQSLSPRDRFFVDLCFRQSLTPQDVAGICRISVPAVYTHKSRILAKLRESLTKTGTR